MNDPQNRRPAPGPYEVRGSAGGWHPVEVRRAGPEGIDVCFNGDALFMSYAEWHKLALCGEILHA